MDSCFRRNDVRGNTFFNKQNNLLKEHLKSNSFYNRLDANNQEKLKKVENLFV